ncbi:MAG: autotransporter outer membrane beta-barrel domain-containing protein [Brevundimonas sp.]
MRKLLATAVAIAPLMIASGAHAEIVISTARTTPIVTSNATGSGPDDVRLTGSAALNLLTGTAITVDSSNNLTLETGSTVGGTNTADGMTGILVNGGNTTTIIIAGTVGLGDSIDTYPDDDKDGDLDGPQATGTGRYGVRLVGATPVTGNLRVESTGSVLVEGNNSFGISIESGLVGNLTTLGTIRVTGDNALGVVTTSTIDGNVMLSGTIAAVGLNATAASIQGDVNGALRLQGDISSTGYRYTSRGTTTFMTNLEAEDKLQNGAAVIIAADVTGGVVFDRIPTETDANSTDDDGDGVLDSIETTANINSYGEAPAVLVGSASRSIALGVAGTGSSAFGFINRGSIIGQGVYDGLNSNAIQFGGFDCTGVTIDGGVLNEGTIAVLGYQGDATAIHFGNGVSTPIFINTNLISSAVTSILGNQVVAIQIDAGASVPAFDNSGSILATAGGGTSTTTALLDLSGTLTSITNSRSLQATLSPNADGDAVTGTSTAIDVSANTSGVTLVQTGTLHAASAGDPDTDADGVSDAYEPIIVGAIKFGSGDDIADIRNGQVFGDIAFGDGADQLLISGGALVRGALSDTDGLLDIDISSGILDARQLSPLNILSLNVGTEGSLIVTLDPVNGSNSGFVVAGTATFADGAGLGVHFNSLINDPERFTVVHAGTLNFGAVNLDSLNANSPYLFVMSAGADVPAGDVYVDVRRRSATEIGLAPVESAMFDSFYGALGTDAALRDVFLSQTERPGFINMYEQMLPDHSGGPLLSLASGVDAVTRALTGRNASAAPGEVSAWVQEINFYADKDRTDTYGFRSEGFGVAGGVERGSGLGAVGVSLAFTSSDLSDPEAEAEEVLSANLMELGLYWRAQGQYWTTWARAAAGYASFDATRQFVGGGLNLKNESSWNGYTLAAAGGASYERNFGRFSVRPEVYAEYFSLNEDARTESGGGAGFDLNIDKRSGHMFSAVAAVNFGMGMGEDSWLRPEIRVGWRQNLSVDPGETIARFASGGSDFRLTPATIEGGGPIVGFRLNIGNELGMLSINADAEMVENYVRYMLLLRASFRF